MLRGHGTLTRLIGKRRRLNSAPISSHHDAASNELEAEVVSLAEEQFHEGGAIEPHALPSTKNVRETSYKNSREVEDENLFMEWVRCPVCEKSIQGNDVSINIHLDQCLLGETKCKNHQPTLTQLSRAPRSLESMAKRRKRLTLRKEEECSFHLSTMARRDIAHNSMSFEKNQRNISDSPCAYRDDGHKERKGFYEDGDVLNSVEINERLTEDSNASIVTLKQEPDSRESYACSCSCHATPGMIYVAEEAASDCHYHSKDGETEKGLTQSVAKHIECDDLDTNVLQTHIVGRKFNRHAKVEKDMRIKAVREPDNPNDPQAIKIVGLNDSGSIAIGHLPRSLASHLSCLLDKDILDIQGFVDDVPEKAFASVPIKLFCLKKSLGETKDVEFFEKTWQKVLQVVRESEREQSSQPVQSKYLQNFVYFANTVLDHNSDLFSEEELVFLGSFFSLNESAQRLFVRLFQRKGPWFRVSQTSYEDIPDVKQASDELLAAGFMTAGDSLEKDECFEKAIRERMHVLNVPELKQLVYMGNLKKKKIVSGTLRRDELLDLIVSAAKEKHQSWSFGSGKTVISLVLKMIGFCIRISDNASFLFWRLQRLFFLNGEQDISAFLLVNIGAIKYPIYNVSHTQKVFKTREALLSYEQALEVAQAMDMAMESNDQETVLLCLDKACTRMSINEALVTSAANFSPGDMFLSRFTAPWVYATVVTLGVSVLERDRRYVKAIELLKQLLSQSCCPGRRGYWTVRLSLDLDHVGRKEESLEVAEAGLNDSRIRNGDRIALQRRVLRLGKPPRRWKKPPYADALVRPFKEVFIRGRPINCITGSKSRFYGFDGQQCSVEELALQYYAGESGGGWQGVHSENGVWTTLFALLMWEILFADAPNVFWHPFQTAPLDLDTDAFYPARKVIIEAQLSRIRDGEASQIVAKTWSTWFGTLCRGLNWERHSLEELQTIVSCVGGSGLASICKLLAEDHAGWRGGMPDLLLWRAKSPSRICRLCSCRSTEAGETTHQQQHRTIPVGEAKLVEVKGPRDRLSEQQRAWIFILMEAGIQVEVCKVVEEPKSQDM